MKNFTINIQGGPLVNYSTENTNQKPLIIKIMRIGFVYLLLLVTTLQLLFAVPVKSQKISEITVKLEVKNEPLLRAFKKIEQQTLFRFVYRKGELRSIPSRSISASIYTVEQALDLLLEDTDFSYKQVDNNVLIMIKDNVLMRDGSPFQSTGIKAETAPSIAAIPIKGQVTNSEGEPLQGVNITLKGTTIATTSDLQGRYTINVPDNSSILVFTYLGYITQEIAVNARQEVDVVLATNVQNLQEVVVVGYGTMTKKDLTGSVSSIKAEALENEKPQNLQAILRGNVAGLKSGSSGISAKGGGALEIRGTNGLKTSSAPLIVLDGVIYPGDLEDINPYDIETLDVLKDASSAAVFGARASNGVIMITTKKGKVGKPMINFTTSNGLSTIATFPSIYQADAFINWRSDVLKSENRYNPGTKNKLYKFDNPNNLPTGITLAQWLDGSTTTDVQDLWLSRVGLLAIEKANYAAGKPPVDYADMVFRNGLRQDYNLAISGKKDEVSYYWSMGHNKNEGIVVGDDYSAIRSRINLDSKITNWLSGGFNLQYANRDESAIPVNWQDAEYNSPWGSPFEADGVTMRYYPTEDILNTNPLYNAAFQKRQVSYNTVIGSLYTEFKLPFGISYKASFAPRFSFYKYMNHQSSKSVQWALIGGQVNRNSSETYSWQMDNIVKWNKTVNQIHKIDVTLLANMEKFQSWSNTMQIRGFSPTDALGFHNTSSGSNSTTSIGSSDQYDTGDALMARAFYSFKDKYMLTASIRRDGFSAFGTKNPRGTFPSVALGWIFTDENFFKSDILTQGKLRVSWGENGNRDVGRYSALSALALGKFAYQTLGGAVIENNILSVTSMANADLKWERTKAINLGIDFSIKNGLLDGSIDVYKKQTNDLLVDRALPDVVGVPSVVSNLGEVDNKGVELNLGARILNTRNFKWRSNLTFSLNRNEIVHLYGDMVDVKDATGNVIGQKEGDDITNLWFIGHAIDEIWDPVILGVWQIGEEAAAAKQGQFPGDFKIKDTNGDGLITYADYEFQGFKSPRFQWHLRQEVNLFKNFDFSLTVYSQWGQKGTFNNAKNNDRLYPDRFNSYVVPYWTPENKLNDWARINSAAGSAVFNVYRDKSYIRFDNLSLTYSIPKEILTKVKISNLKVTGGISNLGWWAPNWELVDPESAVRSGNGSDTPEPAPRSFTFGINLTL